MDLKFNKQFISADKFRNANKAKADRRSTPLNQGRDIKFTGSVDDTFSRVIDKTKKNITLTNAQKVVEAIDQVLGSDKFFTNVLYKAGFVAKDASGKIVIPDMLKITNQALASDLYYTLTFPIFELPVRAANAVLKKIGATPIQTKRLRISEILANQKLCTDILDKFTSLSSNEKISNYFNMVSKENNPMTAVGGQKFSLANCREHFKDYVALDVNKLYKGYSTRDERTLNRLATSMVSALYSANDFYNISMLQKDDKDEAKKAHHSRLKQEITRMFLSAGTTFVTLGALDKIVKKSIIINAVVIALSSLISEVGSRIFSRTPLHPLTPEQAKKIAQKRKLKNAKKEAEKQQNLTSNPNIASDKDTKKLNFTGINSNQDNLFIQFASKDGTFASMNSLVKSTAKEAVSENGNNSKKKKFSLSQIFGYAVLGCCAFYVISRSLKGQIGIKIERKKLYENGVTKSAIINALRNETSLPDHLETAISNMDKKYKRRMQMFSLETKFKEKFLKYNSSFELDELKNKVIELRKTKKGIEIAPILDEFLENITKLKQAALESKTVLPDGIERIGDTDKLLIHNRKDLPALPGLYNGFTKVFKTIYQILSAPAMLVEMLMDKTIFKESEAAFAALKARNDNFSLNEVKKELVAVYDLVSRKSWSNEKILDYIKRNTRAFESSSETGELANLSRTMVTAISTYFFVNDYTNKVLIESEGKDVEAAKEERNERLAHKISNFIINGTLMNVFNSVFRFPLNRSLLDATLIAGATETTNEFFVRKSICQPFRKMKSKDDIIKYENEQMSKKGFIGWWSRTFKKLTGKKSLTQKVGIASNDVKKDK